MNLPNIPTQGAKNHFFFLTLIAATFIIAALVYSPSYLNFGFAVFGTFLLMFLINLLFTKAIYKKKLSQENRVLEFILVITIGIVGLLLSYYYLTPTEERDTEIAASYKDIAYLIENKPILLTNGVSEVRAAPGSTSKIITRYFGNELKTDLNNDGREDIVFILTQQTGGSGTFFYAVAALNTEKGYVGSDGYLLGDRIAPQTTNLSPNPRHKNVIVVNYADRKPGEPMTAQPSVGKSAYLKLDPVSMQWNIVVPDFEGESR